MVHIECCECRKVVGVTDSYRTEKHNLAHGDVHDSVYYPLRRCEGNHLPSESITHRAFFGLLRVTETRYPETATTNVEYTYVGRRNKFLLAIATWRAGGRVCVGEGSAYWSFKTGFFGDGYREEFLK